MRDVFVNRSLLALAILCGIVFGCYVAFADEIALPETASAPAIEMQYIAIMGEVARPGVFETTESSLQLLELVKRAGGVTSGASGNVRVIRDGRAGEQTCLATGLNYPLLPNDLVIVDSWQSWADRPFSDDAADFPADHDSDEAGALPAPSLVIQLGLVNLISRPVILDVTPEEATLGTVLSLLHQSQRGIREVTVLKPLRGVESVTYEEGADVSLVSGTVLIFDPATVDARALPQLPATVPSPANSPANLPPNFLVPDAAPPAPQESIPQMLTRQNAEAREKTARRARSEKTTSKEAERQAAAKQKPKTRSAPENLAAADEEPKQSRAGVGGMAVLVLISVGAASYATVRVRRWRARRPVAPVVTRELAPVWDGARVLKVLISNGMPVVEEPLVLPKEVEIFGRPRLDSPYRIDAAHILSGPHYPVEREKPVVEKEAWLQSTREPVQKSATARASSPSDAVTRKPVSPTTTATGRVAVLQSADDEPARKIRIDNAHPRSSLGTLDRALATFEEGRS